MGDFRVKGTVAPAAALGQNALQFTRRMLAKACQGLLLQVGFILAVSQLGAWLLGVFFDAVCNKVSEWHDLVTVKFAYGVNIKAFGA